MTGLANQTSGPNDEERGQPRVPTRTVIGALLVIGQLSVGP